MAPADHLFGEGPTTLCHWPISHKSPRVLGRHHVLIFLYSTRRAGDAPNSKVGQPPLKKLLGVGYTDPEVVWCNIGFSSSILHGDNFPIYQKFSRLAIKGGSDVMPTSRKRFRSGGNNVIIPPVVDDVLVGPQSEGIDFVSSAEVAPTNNAIKLMHRGMDPCLNRVSVQKGEGCERSIILAKQQEQLMFRRTSNLLA